MFGIHSALCASPARGNSPRSVIAGMTALLFIVPLVVSIIPTAYAATAPNLGVAEAYAIFGKAGVTNDSAVGITHIWGDVGADASVTNLNDATQVDGSINIPAPGVEAAILAAFGQLSAQGVTGTLDLAGTNTVVPGVYTVGATTLNGTLTLNGAGVYIFRSSSSISTSGPAIVNLINGASPCNVFWEIPGGIAIGAGTQMVGTIITDTASIALSAGATLKGRALSRIAQVTLNSNQITEPTCAASANVEADATARSRRPMISVTKIPAPLALPGPGSVTYTYEVSNPGMYAMSTVTLADDKCSDVTYISGDNNNDDILQITEVWTYRCAMMLTQDTNNIATAIGYANGLPATDLAYATVSVGSQLTPPLIHIVKKPSKLLLPFGRGNILYTYTLTNPGVVAMHDIDVKDNKCADVKYVSGDTDTDDELDTTEAWIFRCESELETTTTNTVIATGNANNLMATDVAFATVIVSPAAVIRPPVVNQPPAEVSPEIDALPPAPEPTPEIPLLPNTGAASTTSTAWQMIVAGVLVAFSFVYVRQLLLKK